MFTVTNVYIIMIKHCKMKSPQAYNKTTKLTIPQKTSEKMDNLHIDLLSKTLPVE